jgi:hypothetical protein
MVNVMVKVSKDLENNRPKIGSNSYEITDNNVNVISMI